MKKEIEVNGVMYESKTDAFVSIAEKYTFEELLELLEVTPSTLYQWKNSTGIEPKNFIGFQRGKSTHVRGPQPITYDGEFFKTKKEAYIKLAPSHTLKEMSEILDVPFETGSLYTTYFAKTGIKTKDFDQMYDAQKKQKRISIDGIEYNSLTEAFTDVAPRYTREELLDIFDKTNTPSFLNRMENKTGITWKDKRSNKKQVKFNGKNYDSIADAYVELAPRYDLKKLKTVLDLSIDSDYPNVLFHKTGVAWKDKDNPTKSITVKGKEYSNVTEAYKDLAPEHTSRELLVLFDKKSPSFLTKLRQSTGVSWKKVQNVQIDGVLYADEMEAFKKLAPNYTSTELLKMFNKNNPIFLTRMRKKTGVDWKHHQDIKIGDVIYSSIRDAYKHEAPNYTSEELLELFDRKSPALLTKLYQETGIPWKNKKR